MRLIYAVHRQFDLIQENSLEVLQHIVNHLEPEDRSPLKGFGYRGSTREHQTLLTDLYRKLRGIDPQHRLLRQLHSRTSLVVDLDTPHIYHLYFPIIERGHVWFPIRRTIAMTSDHRQIFRPLSLDHRHEAERGTLSSHAGPPAAGR